MSNLPTAQALAGLLESKNTAEVKRVCEVALEESVLPGISKPLLTQITAFVGSNKCDDTTSLALVEFLAPKLLRRLGPFGEECVRCYEILADHYETSGRYKELVRALATIPTEQGLRSSLDNYQLSLNVRIVQNALKNDDLVTADNYIGKAWAIDKRIPKGHEVDLHAQFLGCFATVSDTKRKLIDAAQKYYELSTIQDDLWPLRSAIVCVVLADAGPHRSRLLATLYRDERTAGLGDLYVILSKVFHARVLRPKDVELLAPYLKDHHKAIGASGHTVVDVAIFQHNIQACSQLYYNIRLSELAALLGVPVDEAERIAGQMIAEERLKASVDQVTQILTFHAHQGPDAQIHDWDSQISSVCNSVASICDSICQAHPQYLAILKGAK